MPIYEFSCTKCGTKTEKRAPVEERDKAITCDSCGADAVRVVSLTSPAQFKGSGWTQKGS